MKALIRVLVLLLSLAALPLAAQSTPAPRPPAPATNPAVGPGEPDIVLPQVILQVEDLSVEKVEAKLPPEEDLLPPVRGIPLLSEGELAVGEPTIPAPIVQGEGTPASSGGRQLSSEIQLGTGMQNLILGSVSLKTMGPDPRFSLQFHHETLDGFAGRDPGAGYNLRNDTLDGGVKFALGGVDADISGRFQEDDHGLQAQSASYSSVLSRAVSGNAAFSGVPLDWLTLAGGVGVSSDSLLLQGTVPLSSDGLRVSPSLSAKARVGAFTIGLETSYWYRDESYLLGADDQMHRVKIASTASVKLPAQIVLEASVAWFWNSAGLSRFPFTLSITATPVDFLTASIAGGYAVVPYDLHDVISAHAFALPTPLEDDRGWFGSGEVQLTLTQDLALTAKLAYMKSDAMPFGSTAQDATTRLFPVTQDSGARFTSDAGLRWGINQAFSLSAAWTHEFLDRLFFTPIDTITTGIVGLDPNGRFGGSVNVAIAPLATDEVQDPVLRVSGFWKIIDAVKLQLDAEDLLLPLFGRSKRYDIPPYLDPGFRIAGSLSISL